MLKRVKVIVSGRVQGVSYRDFVRKTAESLNLLGTVKNMDDGSVEIIAEGDDLQLKRLLEICQKGSDFSEVMNIEDHWSDFKDDFKDFKIIY